MAVQHQERMDSRFRGKDGLAMDSRSPIGVGDKLRGKDGWPSGPRMDKKTAVFMAMPVWMLRQVLR